MSQKPRLDRPNLYGRCSIGCYALRLEAGDTFDKTRRMLYIMGVSAGQVLMLNEPKAKMSHSACADSEAEAVGETDSERIRRYWPDWQRRGYLCIPEDCVTEPIR